ncbi:MAG: 7-cyano-7-deazaguanine synthase QueC [Calditerrivibrio sp.]|nr:7-cyano-7-deazaguanine synthase QueC [Calditerrivibrio sp.]MCA1979918.1 7-cyano-7-deazaguanine synthase QueC [Calditerrivibrio sp.]
MQRAIVLVSGGMDSCVTASIAKDSGYELNFLHINYGQRTEKRELESFNKLSEFFKVRNKLVVDITYLKEIGGSSLTDFSIDVEKGEVDRKEIPSTYVPFRNGNIVSIAVSWAEVLKASRIFIGVVEEDGSGYPDCRKSFYDAFNSLLKVGLAYTDLRIETPLISISKGEIVKKGLELGAPFELTWSCYKMEDIACGECDSCLLRLKGFREAGILDPIPYIKR